MFLLSFAIIEKATDSPPGIKGVNPIYTACWLPSPFPYIIQNGSMVLFGSDAQILPAGYVIKNIVLSLSGETRRRCIIASLSL